MEPNNIIVTLKTSAKARPNGAGMNLFDLMIEKSGNGKRRSKKAIVEKEEPVGVKLAPFAKSIGRKMWKNERIVIIAVITPLTYRTYKNVWMRPSVLRWETVTK